MAWKAPFAKAISSFRESDYEISLSLLNEAIQVSSDQYVVYDSRAAVFEKLGRPKDALRDAKNVIDLAPGRWQGYARSARLFLQLNKHDTASKMVELAIERIKEDHKNRRVELEALKQQILDSARVFDERKRRQASRAAYHGGKLPVEIFGEIFELLVSDVTQAIILSHVCMHWRAVALHTPSLWRTLVLAKKDPAGKTREWVKRSQGHIRELCIRPRFEDSGVPLSSALLGFPWKHLRVCRLDHAASLTIYKILMDLSIIHTLSNLVELEHAGWPGNERNAHFPFQIPNALLQSLTIKNQRFRWDVVSKFSNLVSLVVANGWVEPGGNFIGVFEANPMLEKVVVDVNSQHLPSVAPMQLTLHRLTQMEICGLSAYEFQSVTIPSLHILRMTRVVGADMLIRSVFNGGAVALMELTIQSSLISLSDLVPLLQAASSLEAFELSHIDGQVNTVVEALAQPSLLPSSSPLKTLVCPRLTRINLSACPDLKTGALMRLVKSRLPVVAPESHQDMATLNQDIFPVAQIETLIVDKCPLIEPDALPWLRSKVQVFSCVYATGKDARWRR